MCGRNKWKKGLLSIGLTAVCFLAVPSGVYASENAQIENPQTEGAGNYVGGAGVTFASVPQVENTDTSPQSNDTTATEDDALKTKQGEAKAELENHMQYLKNLYGLDDAGVARLKTVYDNAIKQIDAAEKAEEVTGYADTAITALDNVAVSYLNSQNNITSSDTSNIKNDNQDRIINDDDRAAADEDMLYYMNSLKVRYRLDEKVMENLRKVFDSAVYYIANTDMTVGELAAYVTTTKSNM